MTDENIASALSGFGKEIDKMIEKKLDAFVKNIDYPYDGKVVSIVTDIGGNVTHATVDVFVGTTSSILNKSGENLSVGDSVKVVARGKNLSNSYVAVRYANTLPTA